MFCLSGDAQDSRSSDQFSRNDGGAEPNARRPRRRSRARVVTEASEDTACNPIEAAARALTCEFAAAGDVSGQIARLIDMGRAFDGLPDGDKNAVTRIHGCQSQLWLKAQLNGPIMTFRADSGPLVMRGLLRSAERRVGYACGCPCR